MTSEPACKGEVWLVRAGELSRYVLVISSDMFNLDSGLGHVITMLVMAEPGPYSVAAALAGVHEPGGEVSPSGLRVWPAHHIRHAEDDASASGDGGRRSYRFSSAYTAVHDGLRIVDPAEPVMPCK